LINRERASGRSRVDRLKPSGCARVRGSGGQGDRSPVTRDCHAGICGSRRVRSPPATRHIIIITRDDYDDSCRVSNSVADHLVLDTGFENLRVPRTWRGVLFVDRAFRHGAVQEMKVWPFAAALRWEAANHHMLRWLKTVVVSDVEKAHEMRQVGTGKTVRSPHCGDRC
jgi:hypothetical protein